MEDDLTALFAQLEEAQEAKATTRLSERVIVDLVNKLKEAGLFGNDLLHTINGREYITKQRINEEILDSLKASGGRLAVVDLQALIGVDLTYCEAEAQKIAADSGGSINLVQGDLVSDAYFQSIAAEVDEALIEAGALEIGDIAKRFSFSVDQVLSCVQMYLGSIIHGTLEGNVLYTQAFVGLMKGCLRGALVGILHPVSVVRIAKSLSLPSCGVGGSKIVSKLVSELLEEGCIKGTCKGSNLTFTPTVYVTAQSAAVTNFYAQNNYVEYELCTRVGLTNPKTFLRGQFPDGIALQNAFVAPVICGQADASVEEAISAGTWLDTAPLYPQTLSTADMSALVAASSVVQQAVRSGAQVAADTCVLSRQVLDHWHARAEEIGKAAAQASISGRSSKTVTPVALPPTPVPASEPEEDWSVGPARKGKKGKGGKFKASAPSSAAGSKQTDAVDPHMPTQASLATMIAQECPDMTATGTDDQLCSCLASIIHGATVSHFLQALKSALTLDSQDVRRQAEEAQEEATKNLFTLMLHARGLEAVVQAAPAKYQQATNIPAPIKTSKPSKKNSSAAASESGADDRAAGGVSDLEKCRDVMERHVVRTSGVAAGNAVLQYLIVSSVAEGEREGSEMAVGPNRVTAMTTAQREALVLQLPGDVRPAAKNVLKVLATGNNSGSCIEAMEKALEAGGVRARKVDKKIEKQAVATEKQALLTRIQTPGISGADMLALVIPYCVAKCHGKLVNISGRSIAFVLESLQASLSPEEQIVLSELHQAILAQLRATNLPPGEDSDTTQMQLTSAVEEIIPKVLAICNM